LEVVEDDDDGRNTFLTTANQPPPPPPPLPAACFFPMAACPRDHPPAGWRQAGIGKIYCLPIWGAVRMEGAVKEVDDGRAMAPI
jgi:hypothetical protein